MSLCTCRPPTRNRRSPGARHLDHGERSARWRRCCRTVRARRRRALRAHAGEQPARHLAKPFPVAVGLDLGVAEALERVGEQLCSARSSAGEKWLVSMALLL